MSATQISFCNGSPSNPYSGRFELRLYADDRFEASYEHRKKRTSWRGTLVRGTFDRATAAVSDAGFPRVAPIAPVSSGSYPVELALETDGTWERIEIGEGDRTYVAISIIASSILSMLEPKIARMPPGQTTPIVDVQQHA